MGCGRPPLLTNTYPSVEQLATAVVEAISGGDMERLRALALDEEEFREHVWPELPAGRQARRRPCSFVWGDLNQKSGQALAGTGARHRGRQYTVVSVRFGGEATRCSTHAVH